MHVYISVHCTILHYIASFTVTVTVTVTVAVTDHSSGVMSGSRSRSQKNAGVIPHCNCTRLFCRASGLLLLAASCQTVRTMASTRPSPYFLEQAKSLCIFNASTIHNLLFYHKTAQVSCACLCVHLVSMSWLIHPCFLSLSLLTQIVVCCPLLFPWHATTQNCPSLCMSRPDGLVLVFSQSLATSLPCKAKISLNYSGYDLHVPFNKTITTDRTWGCRDRDHARDRDPEHVPHSFDPRNKWSNSVHVHKPAASSGKFTANGPFRRRRANGQNMSSMLACTQIVLLWI